MDYQSDRFQKRQKFDKEKRTKKEIFPVEEYMTEALKQQIISSANIVDVVGAFVDLKRRGADYLGLCPFHPDKKPSLSVHPKDNICKCFACGDKAMDSIGFLMRQGMSFMEALKWIANQNHIPIDGQVSENAPIVKKERPKAEPLYLDIKNAEIRVGNYDKNPFVIWLKSLAWCTTIQKASIDYWLKEYYVGTSIGGSTNGWTIWWLVDAANRLLTGKMMKYKTDGHRDKDSQYNIDHIHSVLQRAGMLNLEGKEIQKCLFGLHLVFRYDFKTVCIVESEKSAIVAQIFNDDTERVFVATGGKGGLTENMLKPLVLKGCDIVLYPDIDAYKEWSDFVRKFDYKRISVTKNIMEMYDPEKDSPKADIADILVRRLEDRRNETLIKSEKVDAEK